eukprot:2364322-Pyramimonas_sp.AAC.1
MAFRHDPRSACFAPIVNPVTGVLNYPWFADGGRSIEWVVAEVWLHRHRQRQLEGCEVPTPFDESDAHVRAAVDDVASDGRLGGRITVDDADGCVDADGIDVGGGIDTGIGTHVDGTDVDGGVETGVGTHVDGTDVDGGIETGVGAQDNGIDAGAGIDPDTGVGAQDDGIDVSGGVDAGVGACDGIDAGDSIKMDRGRFADALDVDELIADSEDLDIDRQDVLPPRQRRPRWRLGVLTSKAVDTGNDGVDAGGADASIDADGGVETSVGAGIDVGGGIAQDDGIDIGAGIHTGIVVVDGGIELNGGAQYGGIDARGGVGTDIDAGGIESRFADAIDVD